MKTPIEINITKDGAIKINVDLARQGSVKAASATSVDRDATDLELRLMTTDDNDEAKQLALSMDVLRFAEKKLKANDKKGLLKFLNDNKQRFSADLKEWLKDAISAKQKETS